MADKQSMIFHYDWMETLQEFEPAEAWAIVDALVAFAETGEDPDMEDRAARIAYKTLKKSVVADMRKYQEKCEKNRAAAKERWAMQTDANACECINEDANECIAMHDDAKNADNGYLITDNGYLNTDIYAAEDTPARMETVIQTWNSQQHTKDIEKISFGSHRHSETMLRIGNDFDAFLETIRMIESQEWLVQKARDGTPVTYDWFLKNYEKIREGNYAKVFNAKKNKFKNFSQRGYDFDDLEQKLLGRGG